MSFKPGDSYYSEFVTSHPTTGAATDADSLPVAIANRNGADDGAFNLTVTRLDAGRYKVTGTIPSGYASGDVVNVSVAATVATVAGKGVIDSFVLDGARVSEVKAVIGAAGAGLTALGDSRLGYLDAAVSTRSTYSGGAVASVTGAVGSVAGAVGSVTAPVTVGTNNDKTGYALSASGVDLIIVEPAAGTAPAINFRQAVALVLDASPAGILVNVTSTQIGVQNPGGTITRALVNVDANGNRTGTATFILP